MDDDTRSRRDDRIGFALALILIIATVALAHVLPMAGAARVPSTPAAFDREPTCAEWTDGCIVCRRTDQGLACSTPGIACVPKEQQCLRREGV
jgi:hypothetical protein